MADQSFTEIFARLGITVDVSQAALWDSTLRNLAASTEAQSRRISRALQEAAAGTLPLEQGLRRVQAQLNAINSGALGQAGRYSTQSRGYGQPTLGEAIPLLRDLQRQQANVAIGRVAAAPRPIAPSFTDAATIATAHEWNRQWNRRVTEAIQTQGPTAVARQLTDRINQIVAGRVPETALAGKVPARPVAAAGISQFANAAPGADAAAKLPGALAAVRLIPGVGEQRAPGVLSGIVDEIEAARAQIGPALTQQAAAAKATAAIDQQIQAAAARELAARNAVAVELYRRGGALVPLAGSAGGARIPPLPPGGYRPGYAGGYPALPPAPTYPALTAGGGRQPPLPPPTIGGYASPPPPRTGAFAEFQRGFFGTSGKGLVEQAGQAAKFSILYGTAYAALFAFAGGLKTAVDSAIQFNSSLSELTVAIGGTQEANFALATALGQQATAYGLAPEQGVAAGARAIGLFGLKDQSPEIQQAQAVQAARVTSGLSFLTGSDPQELLKDLGAIAGAFGLQASSLSQIQDLDAFFTKRFGLETGRTLETGAQISTLGREAGFNKEEVLALAAQLQARTGQTPAAAAGLLSQFFGRAGDPALRETFAQLGIDVTRPFRDQIEQLSQLQLGDELRNQIINAFGRGRSGGAAATIIETFGTTSEAAAEAKAGAASGVAQQQLDQRLQNTGGILAQFGGKLRDLAVNIGNSGLLDFIGLLVLGLSELLDAINPLFAFLASLNASPFTKFLRDAVIALGLFSLSLRLTATQNVLGRVAGLASVGSRAPFPIPVAGRAPTLAQVFTAQGGSVAATSGAVASGAARGLATIATGASGVALAFTAVALTALDVVEGLKGIGVASRSVTGAGALAGQSDQTPDALTANAEAIRAAGAENDKAADRVIKLAGLIPLKSGLFGPFGPGPSASLTAGALTQTDDRARSLAESQAAFYEAAAKRREEVLSDVRGPGIFGSRSAATIEGITSALETMTTAGVSAEGRLKRIRQVFLQIGSDAVPDKNAVLPGAADVITQQLLAQQGTTSSAAALDLQRELVGGKPVRRGSVYSPTYGEGPLAGANLDKEIGNLIAANAEEVQAAIDANLPKKVGKGGFTAEQVDQLVNAVIQDGLGGDPDRVSERIRTALEGQIRGGLGFGGVTRLPKGNQKYTGTLATGLANILDAQYQEEEAALVPGDSLGQLELIKQHYADLRALVKNTEAGPALRDLQNRKEQLLQSVIDAEIADSQRIRSALQGKADSQREIRAIGRRFARRDLRTASRGSVDGIIAVMESVNRGAINAVIEEIRTAFRVAQAAARAANQLAVGLDGIAATAGRGAAIVAAASAANAKAAAKANQLQNVLDALNRATVPNTKDAEYLQDPTPTTDVADVAEETDTAAQIAAAAAAANAARTDDAVASARAAVQVAAADLAAAEKGTVAYYAALQAYYEAQRALEDAILEQSAARRSAAATYRGGAIALARANLANAAAQLESETKGTTAYYQALGQFYEAQRALSDAIRERKYVQDQLRGDVTDPVDQARADLRRARRQQRFDRRRGASQDQLASDRLDVRIAENNVQQTKFQQWLSDLQTAEDLERIGHDKYVRTLERRINRLKAIKNRTRQEQDNLDQLESTLREAQKALSGQFNIGNIKIPTPYEARRYIEEQAAARDRQLKLQNGGIDPGSGPRRQDAQTSVSNTLIQIDGADVAKVKHIIYEVLGRKAINTTATRTGKR